MVKLINIAAADLIAGDLVKCGPDDFRRVGKVTHETSGRHVSVVWEPHTVPAGKNLWTVVRTSKWMRIVNRLGGDSLGSGRACAGVPHTIRGAESAETWADAWNVLAERRSEAAAAAAERERCGVAGGSFVTVAGQGSFGALGGGGTGRPALVDETQTRWGYFPPAPCVACERAMRGGWQAARVAHPGWQGDRVESGWRWDRQRRQEAASTAGGTGWQMVGGINAGRLMAAGAPLDRSDDDSTVCVTPAGKAALAGFVGLDRMRDHGWTWDLDLQVRPGETRRDQGRREHERMCQGTPDAPCPFCHGRGSEDDVRERERHAVTPPGPTGREMWAEVERERQSWQAPQAAPALTADDLHDLRRCLCVRCARERRAARAHAEAVVRGLLHDLAAGDDRGEV